LPQKKFEMKMRWSFRSTALGIARWRTQRMCVLAGDPRSRDTRSPCFMGIFARQRFSSCDRVEKFFLLFVRAELVRPRVAIVRASDALMEF